MTPPSQPRPNASITDEMTIFDFIQLLKESWWLLLMGCAIGIASAAAYLKITPSQYESTARIEIGKIRHSRGVDWIEPPAMALERIKSPVFIDLLTGELNWDPQSKEALILKDSLKGDAEGSAVTIKVRSYSPGDARRVASTVASVLRATHKTLVKEFERDKKQELEGVVADRAVLEQRIHWLDGVGTKIPQGDLLASMVWRVLKDDYIETLTSLRKKEKQAKEQLERSVSDTVLAGEPSLTGRPVHPNRRSIWLLGVVAGGLFGLFMVALRPFLNDKSALSKPSAAK